VLDLTGQELDVAGGAQLGNFSVVDPPADEPKLVATFPRDGAINQGESTQIVAVFDRPVEENSVDGISFDVKVAGADPPNDPIATPIVVEAGTTGVEDTRAFLYRSLDGDGRPVSLGNSVEVELALSPASNPITDDDNDELAPSTISFTTLAFSPPLSASLLSDPTDAIGLANLTPDDPEELTVEVVLDAGEVNDSIDLFLFGIQRSANPDSPLIALQRTARKSRCSSPMRRTTCASTTVRSPSPSASDAAPW
jgi:hypothetical protein